MTDNALIQRAEMFATQKHHGQVRKDAQKSPYITHPLALLRVLTEVGNVTDTATLCGAILHDTVEDTETSEQELTQEFGAEIAGIVMEVTDDKSLDKAVRKQRQIEHAAHISDKAKLVKLADKICNLRDIKSNPPVNWPLERKQAYFDWAKAVVDALRGVSPALEAAFDEACSARP